MPNTNPKIFSAESHQTLNFRIIRAAESPVKNLRKVGKMLKKFWSIFFYIFPEKWDFAWDGGGEYKSYNF